MSNDEVEAFLTRERTMVMSSMGADDEIHSVAMWYGYFDGKLHLVSKRAAQKVRNLERDPRITCLVEAGDTYDTLIGVSVVGRARLSSDRDDLFQVGRRLLQKRRASDQIADEDVARAIHKRVIIRVDPIRVISWDHSKLTAGGAWSK